MSEFRKFTDTEQYAYQQTETALGHLREAIKRLEAETPGVAVLDLLRDTRLCLVDLAGELDLQAHKRNEAPRGRRASDAPGDFTVPSFKDQLVLEAYRALTVLKDLDHPVAETLEVVLHQATEGE